MYAASIASARHAVRSLFAASTPDARLFRWAAAALCCVLYSYFLLLPLREDAALSLGAHKLPALFMGSLVATVIAAPLAGSAPALMGQGRGQSVVLQSFAAAMAGLYALVLATRGYVGGAPLRPWLSALVYVVVNLMNLVGASTLWALCAACFTPTAAKQRYGQLSAGATTGQLLGSATALVLNHVVLKRSHGPVSSAGGPALLLLLSCGLLLVAAHCAECMGAAAADIAAGRTPADRPGSSAASAVERQGSHKAHPSAVGVWRAHWHHMRTRVTRVPHVVGRVVGSGYLRLVCGYIGLSSVASSMVYFLRAVVVSHGITGTASRLAFFASLNTFIATAILVLQLTATAPLLRWGGIRGGLLASPALCLVAFGVLVAAPVPFVVAGVEVLRKLTQYALGRPSREVLFTAMTPEELGAKVVVDSLVGRVADTLAAALFHVLSVQLHLGPGGLAGVSCMLCAVWLLAASKLSSSFEVRQQLVAAGKLSGGHSASTETL